MKRDESNIVSLLTGPGAGAIAVIRITGDRTAAFLSRHFSRKPEIGRAVHGDIIDADRIIDDALLVIHESGRAADLNVHGGSWVVRQVMELARRDGFEAPPSEPGPLPPQSVDAADELERQLLLNFPLASTELAIRWLVAWEKSRRRAGDLVAPSIEADHSLWHLLHPPHIAIVGPPNAGKSTLANELFATERSIVADMPGTTRDWVGEIADIDGLAVFLMDTPGLRHSEDSIEQAAIATSRERISQADMLILVVDGTHPIAEQREWAARFPGALVVRNKCDLAAPEPIDSTRPHVHTVANIGVGIPAVRQAIKRRFVRSWRQP